MRSLQLGGDLVAARGPVVVSVVGPQDAGKTTLGTRMVQAWTRQGLRVAALKHDGHAAIMGPDDWEKPGGDTHHYVQAGAAYTLLAGGGQSLLRTAQESAVNDVHALCQRLTAVAECDGNPLDVIVVEGYKRSDLGKIAVVRRPEDWVWLQSEHLSNLRAVVCSDACYSLADGVCPVYHEGDADRLCMEIWNQRSL